MARKPASALQARNEIKKKYKRGPRAQKVLRGEDSLSATEKYVKMEIACFLKAQDYSWNYISDSLGISKDVLRRWYSDPELGMQARVEEIMQDIVTGAVKLLKTYAIEIIEELMVIFRTTADETLASRIGFDLLDRLGIAKVNKSESVVAQTNTSQEVLKISDPDGILEKLKDASPEAQAEAAAHLEAALALALPEGVNPDE